MLLNLFRLNSRFFNNSFISKNNLCKCLSQFSCTKNANRHPSTGNHLSFLELTNNQFIRSRVRHFTVSLTLNYSEGNFLDENTYEEVADKTLDILNDKLEFFLDQLENKTYDTMLNNGVITLSLGDKGTYVINKQTPNKQIWLSSPISGPKRYDYIDGEWIYKHTGQSLKDLLKTELEQTFNVSLDLSLE